MTGVFPSVLKTAKVVPVFQKDSKLACSNYRPISLLSNIEKVIEKLIIYLSYTDYIPFLITIILSITYTLDLDNNILYLIL